MLSGGPRELVGDTDMLMVNGPPPPHPHPLQPTMDTGMDQQQLQQQPLQHPMNVDSSRYGNVNSSSIPELTVTRSTVSAWIGNLADDVILIAKIR